MRAEPGAVEEVVAEDQRAAIAVEELFAQQERLGESVRLILHDVGDGDAELRTVTEQSPKSVLVVRCRNEKNFTKSGQHQGAERVIDHWLVVNRQQLLGHRTGYRVKADRKSTRLN